MKDLLGTDQPDPPAMTAPLPLRVFRLGDYEWWLAPTFEAAAEAYTANCGEPPDDAHAPYQLTMTELVRLKFMDTDDNEVPIRKSRRSFKEELARQIATGDRTVRLFACTEY